MEIRWECLEKRCESEMTTNINKRIRILQYWIGREYNKYHTIGKLWMNRFDEKHNQKSYQQNIRFCWF
jgi:hypothetical protein